MRTVLRPVSRAASLIERATMKTKFALSFCCLILAGCGTPHQPYSFLGGGGYRDVQLSENVFKVTVEANAYTSKSDAADLALLRSAELAVERGFKFFIIGATEDNSYSGAISTPSTTQISLTRNGNSAYGTARTTGGDNIAFTLPTPSMTIVCFTEKPKSQGTVYDAAIVAKSMRARFGMK